MHRGEDLHVAPRVEPEAFRDTGEDDFDGQRGGDSGVLAWEQVEVLHVLHRWRFAGVDAVGVGDDPDSAACRKVRVSRTR
jgi:hypothetical protein